MKVELVGGPWDGKAAEVKDPPDWIWAEGDPNALKSPAIYRTQKDGRLPYRAVVTARTVKEQAADRRATYLFAGHSHVACPGCNARHALFDEVGESVKSCTLCGALLSSGL